MNILKHIFLATSIFFCFACSGNLIEESKETINNNLIESEGQSSESQQINSRFLSQLKSLIPLDKYDEIVTGLDALSTQKKAKLADLSNEFMNTYDELIKSYNEIEGISLKFNNPRVIEYFESLTKLEDISKKIITELENLLDKDFKTLFGSK